LLEFKITKVAALDSNKIYYQIIDQRTNKKVLNEYIASFFTIQLGNGKNKESYIIDNLTGVINLYELSNGNAKVNKDDTAVLELYLFGKETDLFALHAKTELKINE